MTLPCVISMGSNLGNRIEHLRGGVAALCTTPGVNVHRISSIYETAPWGKENQPPFLNLVVRASTTLSPEELLEELLLIEESAGRVRTEHWGPRTLDCDLIAVGGEHRHSEQLKLPHPLAHERAFVLVPWLEIDSIAQLPGYGSIEELLAGMPPGGVVRLGAWNEV